MNYRLKEAIKTIESYCYKHTNCNAKCDFYNKAKSECILEYTIPCDYSREMERAEKGDVEE